VRFLPAQAESIPRARVAAAEFAARAGLRDERLEAVRLAVSEAVTNVVRHAYRDGGTGAVHVTMSAAGGELWVLVADDGCGYQTPAQNRGLGLGLTLIAKVSDEYVVTERATGGTEVRMRFPLPGDQPVAA
jgi:serine/threonine-protein kinase RsbW